MAACRHLTPSQQGSIPPDGGPDCPPTCQAVDIWVVSRFGLLRMKLLFFFFFSLFIYLLFYFETLCGPFLYWSISPPYNYKYSPTFKLLRDSLFTAPHPYTFLFICFFLTYFWLPWVFRSCFLKDGKGWVVCFLTGEFREFFRIFWTPVLHHLCAPQRFSLPCGVFQRGKAFNYGEV